MYESLQKSVFINDFVKKIQLNILPVKISSIIDFAKLDLKVDISLPKNLRHIECLLRNCQFENSTSSFWISKNCFQFGKLCMALFTRFFSRENRSFTFCVILAVPLSMSYNFQEQIRGISRRVFDTDQIL